MLAAGNYVGITIDAKFAFATVFPTPRESLANSLHKSAAAPDTERIDRINCAKNQVNSFIFSVEVNRFISFSFAFSILSFQGTGDTKYRMSAFGKVGHHVFRSFYPILHLVLW